jgi:putative ABC transport system permease protein
VQSIRIALRNVTRQFRRTLLLGSAVAFGFFIFTLINGFTGGLLDTVEGNVASAFGGHIYVSGTEVSELGSELSVIRDTSVLEDALLVLEDSIASYNTRSSANASLIFSTKEETQFLVGVETAQEGAFLENITFVEGNAEAFLTTETGLLLPSNTLEKLGLEVGESVIVKATTINGQLNIADFIITGSITGQENFGFAVGYARIGALNALLDMEPGQYQTLSIDLEDLSLVEAATDILYQELDARAATVPRDADEGGPDFRLAFGLGGLISVDEDERWEGTKFEITNVNDVLEGLNTLVNVMNGIGLTIFLIIILIIMVGVMNSYRMVMIERTAEIGTMRAMGVQREGIRNIFVWEAFFIAFSGAATGLVVALLTIGGIGLIDFGPNDFSFFLEQGHLRFVITVPETLGNILLICAMSVASVLIPARAAARLKPAEALRASY